MSTTILTKESVKVHKVVKWVAVWQHSKSHSKLIKRKQQNVCIPKGENREEVRI